MQYIWEVVLAAEKNGIREADLRYEVPEVRSPYLEVSFYDLNTQTVEQTAVEVNPFYRFFDIFSEILDINQKGYEKTREIFVDTVFHYLALTDLRMGMSKKDYYLKFLAEELESGQFGSKAKAAAGIDHLPDTLREAATFMEEDSFVKMVLGQEFVDLYVEAKKAEWNEYMSQVSEWEVDKYLYRT